MPEIPDLADEMLEGGEAHSALHGDSGDARFLPLRTRILAGLQSRGPLVRSEKRTAGRLDQSRKNRRLKEHKQNAANVGGVCISTGKPNARRVRAPLGPPPFVG
jgi:hypothetical protein